MARLWQHLWQQAGVTVTLVEERPEVTGEGRGGGLTPAQRILRARIAAYTLHAAHDSREVTRPARDAFMARFERELDPDGVLPKAERSRRAEAGQTGLLHQARLSL